MPEDRFHEYHMEKTLYELLHPAPVDNRTAEEIVADICEQAGITIID